MTATGRYDVDADADDRVGYCTLVVFGFDIDTYDLDGHTNVLRVMDPDDVFAELDDDNRSLSDNAGRSWRVAGVVGDEDPVDHCLQIPTKDLPVEDAAATVLLTDPLRGECRHAVTYCQSATVAEVWENRDSFAAAFGAEMPTGVVEWARRNPPIRQAAAAPLQGPGTGL